MSRCDERKQCLVNATGRELWRTRDVCDAHTSITRGCERENYSLKHAALCLLVDTHRVIAAVL